MTPKHILSNSENMPATLLMLSKISHRCYHGWHRLLNIVILSDSEISLFGFNALHLCLKIMTNKILKRLIKGNQK